MTEAGPTVVVVDDADGLRVLVRTQLRLSRQFRVVGEGASGFDAIELARQHRPDLLLLDVSMPDMDGLEALPRVLEVSPGTKVIMFTGFDERGLADRARELGAVALLHKSVNLETLADDLTDILRSVGVATAPQVAGARGSGVDADQLRAPQQVMTDHLERFRELFDEAAIGMGTMTLTGRLVRANRALSGLVGVSLTDLVGLAYVDLMADVQPDALPKAIQSVTAMDRDVIQLEHGLLVNPGRRVLSTIAPVRDANRRALYLFVQVQDVTGQRAAEEALRQSEERFRLLVDAVSDYAIFMLDRDGIIASWNAGAQRLKGYSAGEIVGTHFRAFYPPDKQAERHPERELELALRDGRYEEEGWRFRKDGSRFWANVVISAVFDATGQHIGFAKVTRDVTERRELLDDLAQAARDQAEFLAVTAHELRTPIGVISGSTDLLHAHWSDLDESERVELLDSMAANAVRLRRLLDDLLTAARLESGAVELKFEDIVVETILTTAAIAARRQHPDAVVTIETPPDLHVRGDAGRIAQAVDNLVNNALGHGESPVTVTADRHGDRVEIRVSDSGPGVRPDIEPRLFDRFATARQRGGTGLGLFIVRELARAHGGDAWYEPVRDDGVPTFVLSLPANGAPPS
ncbi:MAG: hypothetical protein QOG80_1370 [Pseudonocardiales bacterium]|nr:hypothetical protein [Pseudonocardiales bacterium]